MADFFFFTDFESVISQDVGDNFGPTTDTEYRLDNLFNIDANAKVYAACDGILLAQFDPDGSINYVIQPTVQPEFNVGNVKYFLYRGIAPASMINGTDIAVRTNNDLTEKLWYNQEMVDLNSQTTPSTTPPISSIGLHYSNTGTGEALVEDTDLIDSVFFKVDSTQLPLVKAGDYIGNFIGGTTKAGFEIISEKIGGDETMATLRASEHILTVPAPANSDQYEIFLNRHKKEKIHQFLDMVAFFGMFRYSENSLTIPSQNPVTIDQLLLPFVNKNRIYLDIKNPYGYSYDYHGLFGSSIGISEDTSIDPELVPSFDYYEEYISSSSTMGSWPIFLIENQVATSLSSDESTGNFILKVSDQNEVLKYLYLQETRINNESPQNKFQKYQGAIEFSSWVHSSGSDFMFGAAYVVLTLVPNKKADVEGLFIPTKTTVSHVFSLNNLTAHEMGSTDDVTIKSYYNGSVIEQFDYPNHYYDIYASQTGIAKDAESYIFFSYPNKDIGFIRNESLQPNFSFVSGLYRKKKDFHLLLTQFDSNLSYELSEMEDDTEEMNIRCFNAENDALVNKIVPDFFDTIQITHTEYDDIVDLIASNGLLTEFDIYISPALEDATIQFLPGYVIRKSKLILQGFAFVPDTNDSEIELKTVETPITIRSITYKN